MRDINDIMPKIKGMKWGAVTNFQASEERLKMMQEMMPRDEKWHTLFETPDFMHVDNVPIKKKDWESMT